MSVLDFKLRSLLLTCLVISGQILAGSTASAADGLLNEAQWAEEQGNYLSARRLYQSYLDTHSSKSNAIDSTARASVSLRVTVLDEAIRLGPDPAMALLLAALSLRDSGEFKLAIDQLDAILEQFPDSYLRDDAQYLIGYISLMDRFDFASAHEAMRKLARDYPDSRYADTALYSEAIALEQLGNTLGAKERFLELRKRHSQFSLAFIDLNLPRSNMLSRYWFDRADKRLAILDARLSGAAKVVKRRVVSSRARTLRVTVDVDGMSMVLLLTPSRLDSATEFRDGYKRAIERPRAQFYSGVVEGEAESWARVSLEGDSIAGVVQSYGNRYVLAPDSLIGTIDYYQPRQLEDENALPPLHDYVMHPPAENAAPRKRSITDRAQPRSSITPVSRVAQIAIVVDSQYNDYYGGNGLNQAMSVLNVADGIFREDFGLALEVVSATVFSTRALDPMNIGAVTLEKMLRNFREYRLQTAASMQPVSLMYLFSGNQNTDPAIGLAWIGAACRKDGYDVGVTTPSAYGDLLVTHELGHSLGAQHDSDTSCKASANRLMWPRISALTEQEFTSCSRTALNAGLSGSCYLDSLDVSLEMSIEDEKTVRIAVMNSDAARVAEDVILTLDGNGIDLSRLPDGCGERSNAELECRSGMLLPETATNWSFMLAPITGTGVTVMAEAKPYRAADVFTADNSAQLDIRVADDGSKTVSIATGEPDQSLVVNSSGSAAAVPPKRSAGAAAYFCLLAFCLPFRRSYL